MIRTTKISAILLALLFAAGGAMAQATGGSAGTGMSNTGDDNARPTNSATDTKMKAPKAKKAKKMKKSDDGSMKSSNGGANSNPSAGKNPAE